MQFKTYEETEKKHLRNEFEPQQTILNKRIIENVSVNHILFSSWYHSGDERSDLYGLQKGFVVDRNKSFSDISNYLYKNLKCMTEL